MIGGICTKCGKILKNVSNDDCGGCPTAMKYYFFVDDELWAKCDTKEKRKEIEQYLDKSLDPECKIHVIGFGDFMETYRLERGQKWR